MPVLANPNLFKLSSQAASGSPDGNIFVNTSTKEIEFIPASVLANINYGASDPDRPGKPTGTIANPLIQADGALMNAVYSFFIIERKLNETLRKELPLLVSYDRKSGQYDFVNGFKLKTDTDRRYIRNGGWNERDATGALNQGAITRIYYNPVGIGSADAAEVFYYALTSDRSVNGTDLTFPGLPNEPIRVDTSSRTYFEISGRTWQRAYTTSNLTAIGNSEGTGAFIDNHSLTTSADLFVTETENNVSTQSTYTQITLNYLPGTGFIAWQSGVSYVQNAVVSFSGRWYRATSAHTSSGTNEPTDGGAPWVAYEGERLIGASYHPFNVIFAATSGTRTKNQFYQRERWLLRQATNINQNSANTGVIVGRRATPLFNFVSASQMDTALGVYIDSLDDIDINQVRFRDATGTFRTFPRFVATTITLNDTARIDPDLRVSLYFTNAGGNTYPGGNAIIIKDRFNTDMVWRPFTGTINRNGWANATAYAANTVVEDIVGGTWYLTVAGGTSNGSALSNDTGVTWVAYQSPASSSYSFDYDGNTQGGRTAGTEAAISAVATGRSKAQELVFAGNITPSGGAVSISMSTQRNFKGS